MTNVNDRREEERSDCNLAATIDVDGESIVCVVKNLSATGAKIEIDAGVQVPHEFDLLLPAVPGAHQRFRVVTRWRRDSLLGGQFLPS